MKTCDSLLQCSRSSSPTLSSGDVIAHFSHVCHHEQIVTNFTEIYRAKHSVIPLAALNKACTQWSMLLNIVRWKEKHRHMNLKFQLLNNAARLRWLKTTYFFQPITIQLLKKGWLQPAFQQQTILVLKMSQRIVAHTYTPHCPNIFIFTAPIFLLLNWNCAKQYFPKVWQKVRLCHRVDQSLIYVPKSPGCSSSVTLLSITTGLHLLGGILQPLICYKFLSSSTCSVFNSLCTAPQWRIWQCCSELWQRRKSPVIMDPVSTPLFEILTDHYGW